MALERFQAEWTPVGSRISVFQLSIAAVIVAAIGFTGVLASVIVGDDETVPDSRDAATIAVVEPAPAVAPSPVAAQIPAELLIAPPSLPPAPVAAAPAPMAAPAVKPDVTGSIAPTPVPLPRKRATQEPRQESKPDPNRGESASAQIARMKATLKLTPAQEPYWPPVEAALRDILTQLGYDSGQPRNTQAAKRPTAPPAIDQERVQRLTSAAMPLLMTFDDAQKREVRRLARIMGLENVASAI